MGRPICISFLVSIIVCTCAAQQPADSTGLDAFAQQLVNSSAQQRTALLAAHPELLTVALRKELVRQGNILLVDGKYAPALEVYHLVKKITEQIGDKEGLAATSLNIGSVYYFQGQYDLARENYNKAQQLFASLGNRFEVARSLVGLALTFQAQRKLSAALAYFQQALKEFEALNERTGIADALAGIGSIQYEQGNYAAATETFRRVSDLRDDAGNLLRIAGAFYMQKDYAQALAYYERALDYATKRASTAEAMSALSGTANCYYNQRDYDRALEFYNRSLALSEKLNDKSGVATQLQNIGNVYRARGDYGSALQSYLKSLAAANTAPTKGSVATTLGSIGLVRTLQGDNAQAIEYFDKSLRAFEASGDRIGMARLFSYIGNAQYIQGQYDLALAAYQRGLELHRATADTLNQAHVLIGIGTVYVTQQKYASALDNYQQALAIYETLGRKAETAESLTKLAAAYRLQGDYAKGLELANKALTLIQGMDLPAIRSSALTEVGRLQRGLNHREEALKAFNEAIRIQQSMRAETGSSDSETQRSDVLPYLGAMEVLIEQDNPVEAFARAEDVKTQRLREIIQQGNFKVTKEMRASERKEEIRLLGDLNFLRLQLNGVQESHPNDATQIKALRDRLTAARSAYESFRKLLYAKHPNLAIYRGELPPLNVEQMRPLLRSDTAILEYALSEDRVFLFVVTTSENTNAVSSRTRSPLDSKAALVLKAYLLPIKPAEMTERSARFLQLLATKDPSSVQTARELYDLLLKPAEEQIGTRSRLIIVPDGGIWNISFAALQTATDQYLVDQKTISYAISVSALRDIKKRKSVRPAGRSVSPTVLAFANPVLSEEVLERLQTTYRDLPLRRTADAPTELEQLRSIYGKTRSHFYTGINAKKEKARTESSTHSLLHFATQAFLDQSVPLYSFVVLSADPDVSDDGLLRLWEVTNLNSKARVVVLPAANLTQARSQYGNALMAMSWAWFVAGTPTVILSRWEADAASVTEFSSELHRNLRRQVNLKTQKDTAAILRQSVLKLRHSRSGSPYDWSGFMIMGDPW